MGEQRFQCLGVVNETLMSRLVLISDPDLNYTVEIGPNRYSEHCFVGFVENDLAAELEISL